MGKCVSRQTRPSGKPAHLRQEPESYSNDTTYFIQQIVALITHEFHDEPPSMTEALLLTHIYFSDSSALFSAIRERFFINYETYSFITYEQEKINNPPKPSINTQPLPPFREELIDQQHHSPIPAVATPKHDDNDTNLDPMTPTRSSSVTNHHIVYIPTKTLPKSEWIKEVKIPIQRKCLDTLLLWIEKYWKEDFNYNDINDNEEKKTSIFENDGNDLFQRLKAFATEIKQKRDHVLNDDDITLDDEYKVKKQKKPRKETDEFKQIESKYSSFLQEYIFKIENIVNTQQEWYKDVIIDLKQKQTDKQKLLQEQIKKSKRHYRNQKYSENNNNNNNNKNGVNSRRNTLTYSDNIFNKIDLIEPDIDDVTYSMSTESKSEEEEEDENYLANSLLFITVKNRNNAIEYAKQLTLLDWDSFIHITSREFLAKVLNKKQSEKWVQLKLFIDRFQQTWNYVIVSIVAAPNLTARVEMIDFFIFVAESLLKLNNLYSFMSVCTALDSINVQKLKISWDFVSKSNKRKFYSFLSPLCSGQSNYKKLRNYCSKMKPPGIPFLGILLQDITFTNDGNKNKWSKKEDGHINFYKYKCLYTICRTICYLQQGSYSKIDAPIRDICDENDIRFLEKRGSGMLNKPLSIDINTTNKEIISDSEYLSDDDTFAMQLECDGGNQSREPSKSQEASANFLSVTSTSHQQFGISNIEGNEFNLIPDYALQQSIIKDFHSYILLNKSVVKAMTADANRIDAQLKEEYIAKHYNMDKRETSTSKSGLFSLFRDGDSNKSNKSNKSDDDNNNNNNNNKNNKDSKSSIFKLFKKRKSKSLNNNNSISPIAE